MLAALHNFPTGGWGRWVFILQVPRVTGGGLLPEVSAPQHFWSGQHVSWEIPEAEMCTGTCEGKRYTGKALTSSASVPFFRWRNWGSENLRCLSKATEGVTAELKTIIWFMCNSRHEVLYFLNFIYLVLAALVFIAACSLSLILETVGYPLLQWLLIAEHRL